MQTHTRMYSTWHIIAATAAAKSLQSCPTLCDPIDGAHQAPLSLGFSRQEHWSGLPFPSPMHESEKWKGSRSVVSDSLRPHGLQPTRLLHPWDFPGKTTGVGCHCLNIHEMPATSLLKYTRNKQNLSVKSTVKDVKHTQARCYKNNNDEHLSQCCLRPSPRSGSVFFTPDINAQLFLPLSFEW